MTSTSSSSRSRITDTSRRTPWATSPASSRRSANIEYYTTALTAEEAEYGFTFDVEGSAAKDPEWRAKIAAEYNDCHEMAQSWPATSLNRSPMSRMFGRQMLFFKCADRTERRVC